MPRLFPGLTFFRISYRGREFYRTKKLSISFLCFVLFEETRAIQNIPRCQLTPAVVCLFVRVSIGCLLDSFITTACLHPIVLSSLIRNMAAFYPPVTAPPSPFSDDAAREEDTLISLELQDGVVYQGYSFGAKKSCAGECKYTRHPVRMAHLPPLMLAYGYMQWSSRRAWWATQSR